jgi:hypothetical protein
VQIEVLVDGGPIIPADIDAQEGAGRDQVGAAAAGTKEVDVLIGGEIVQAVAIGIVERSAPMRTAIIAGSRAS